MPVMSVHKPLLAAYDIADNGRRARCARTLLDHGVRCQKSVFECRVTTEEVRNLLARVEPILDTDEDRLILIPVSAHVTPAGLGLGEHTAKHKLAPVIA